MAFVSFHRENLDGDKPNANNYNDGALIYDTGKGYSYLKTNGKILSITDRQDVKQTLYTKSELSTATRNGIYYLDFTTDKATENTRKFNINGSSDNPITIKKAYMVVEGNNSKRITQTIYNFNNTLKRYMNSRKDKQNQTEYYWTEWQLQDKVSTLSGVAFSSNANTLNAKLLPGTYYFNNLKDTSKSKSATNCYFAPTIYGFQYIYSAYYVTVEGLPSAAHGTITYYPCTSDKVAPCLKRRWYSYKSGNTTSKAWSSWQVIDPTGIVETGPTQTLGGLTTPGLYFIKYEDETDSTTTATTKKRSITYAGVKISYERAILQVLGWKNRSNPASSKLKQILHIQDSGKNYIFTRRHIAATKKQEGNEWKDNINWSDWTLMYAPNGITLNGNMTDTNLRKLSTGTYLIPAGKYTIKKAHLKGLSKDIAIPTGRLEVQKFSDNYITLSLTIKATNAFVSALTGVAKDDICTLTRTTFKNNNDYPFSDWYLTFNNNVRDNAYSVTSTGIGPEAIFTAIRKEGDFVSGQYNVTINQKKSGDKMVNRDINGQKIRYATVTIEKFGNQIKATMCPVGTKYKLYASGTYDAKKNSFMLKDTVWEWDPELFPKKSNTAYPLATGEYYYKATFERSGTTQNANGIFKLFNEKPFTKKTDSKTKKVTYPANKNAYSIVECFELPMSGSDIKISRINVLGTGSYVGDSYPFIIKVNDKDTSLTLREFIRFSGVEVDGKDYYYLAHSGFGEKEGNKATSTLSTNYNKAINKTYKKAMVFIMALSKTAASISKKTKFHIEFYYTKKDTEYEKYKKAYEAAQKALANAKK